MCDFCDHILSVLAGGHLTLKKVFLPVYLDDKKGKKRFQLYIHDDINFSTPLEQT